MDSLCTSCLITSCIDLVCTPSKHLLRVVCFPKCCIDVCKSTAAQKYSNHMFNWFIWVDIPRACVNGTLMTRHDLGTYHRIILSICNDTSSFDACAVYSR